MADEGTIPNHQRSYLLIYRGTEVLYFGEGTINELEKKIEPQEEKYNALEIRLSTGQDLVTQVTYYEISQTYRGLGVIDHLTERTKSGSLPVDKSFLPLLERIFLNADTAKTLGKN